jgi:hypothetical protein
MIGWAIEQTRRVTVWIGRVKAEIQAWQPPWADKRVKIILTDREPTKPKARRLYVASASGRPTFGYLLCPCGCGETLHLRFLPDRRPRWHMEVESNGVVSLTPSVWRQVGCRSHFVVRKGQVHWC